MLPAMTGHGRFRSIVVALCAGAVITGACGDGDDNGDGSDTGSETGEPTGSDAGGETDGSTDGSTDGGATGDPTGDDGMPPTAEECEEIPDESSCLAAGCTAFVEAVFNSHEDMACGSLMPSQLCILTQSGTIEGEEVGQAYTRPDGSATEVMRLGVAVCDLVGWEPCPSDGPTDMGACACLLETNPCA